MATDVRNLNDDEYVVVDLTTGTVLGTNVVLIKWCKDQYESGLSDEDAWNYATYHGIALSADVE